MDADVVCHDASWLAEQDLGSFEYAPIDSSKNMIRILRVKNANYRDDIIESEIFEACLDDHPTYAALSYYWGPRRFDHQIICNGRLNSITATLHSALKRYRRDASQEKQLWIWADALCINQDDRIELNAQLVLMHRIYSEAAVVDIDLGDTDSSWYPGFDLTSKLCLISEMESDRPGQPDRTPEELHRLYGLPDFTHAAWKAYMHTFSSPWFSRAWTVQEVVLASKARVRFGAFIFDWASLYQSFWMAQRCGVNPLDSLSVGQGMLNVFKLEKVMNMYKRPRTALTFLYTMIITRDFLVSDPRDKIVAVMGLVNEKPSKDFTPFRADYTVSVETFYHRFGVHLVDSGLAQSLLNLAGLHRRNLNPMDIPSWVPDWTAQGRDIASQPLAMFRPTGYQASRISAPCCHLGYDLAAPGPNVAPDVLVIMGDCLDTISGTIEPLSLYHDSESQQASDTAGRFTAWHTAAQDLITKKLSKDKSSSPYKDVANAFARTLLVDDLYTGGNAIWNSTPITDPIATHDAVLQSLLTDVESVSRMQARLVGRMDEATTFQMQMLSACQHRRFAVTEKGYLALVPHCTQLGDRIALFLRAPVPFLLRPTADSITKMQLVGDTYVHGIMDGEGMDFDEFAPREIWLS